MVFPVAVHACESWTINKAEWWRTDAFKWWCWRRLLRVPWTARRSNQSTLKEISPEYSLEGLMCSWNCNTLATWCENLTHWKRPWCWERLKARGEEDDRGWDGWMASLAKWTWVWANYRRLWGKESLTCCSSWSCKMLDMMEQEHFFPQLSLFKKGIVIFTL